jgi:hypothetical protein
MITNLKQQKNLILKIWNSKIFYVSFIINLIINVMAKFTRHRTTLEVPKDPNQRNIPMLFPPRKALRKSLAPSYVPIAHHVYYDGSSFRVRVRIEGKTDSWNTQDKKKALEYRDYLLLTK